MAKRINSFKLSLEKEFGKSKITNEIWKDAMKQARHLYGFKKNPLHYKYSSVASYLIREKMYEERFGEKSFYSRLKKQTGTELEQFENALKEEYEDRLENFKTANLNIEVEYNGETKSLNDWFNEFGKTINKDEMNEIIDLVKETNEYQTKEDYGNGRGAQNKNISEYFE